jgi:Ca-activated chloride channel homolog
MRTTIALDHQPEPAGRHRVRVLLRIEADEPAAGGDDASTASPETAAGAAARPPLDLALVLDRSGSMSGAKLRAAKDAASLLVRRLRARDRIAVVAYDDQVATVAEGTTGADGAELARRIGAIHTGGSTNLSGGWLRGRGLVAERRASEGVVARVLLLTDGLANVGITEPTTLVGLCATARAEGIGTTTIGFGADYDEALLAAMADAGGGHSYYIETPDQAAAIFAEEIGGLLAVAAQNLRVTVRPAPTVRSALVHHAYPRADVTDGARYDVGDLYANDPAALLAEFAIDAGATTYIDVAELVVEADVVEADGRVVARAIHLPVRFSTVEGPCVDPTIQREVLLFEAARARREALERRRRGDDDGARDVLREKSAFLAAAAGEDDELADEARDLAVMADAFDARVVADMDVKYMHQRAYDQEKARRRKSALIARVDRDPGRRPS